MSQTKTRWLSQSEQRLWRAYLEGTQRLWETLSRELDQDGTLPLTEYEVLVRLSEAPDRRLRMSELADLLSHSRSRLTHTVTRMQRRGLVHREPHGTDGRGVVARATDTGLAMLEQAAPTHVTGVREHLFDQMTPDEAEVVARVLGRVTDHLRQVREQDRETLGA